MPKTLALLLALICVPVFAAPGDSLVGTDRSDVTFSADDGKGAAATSPLGRGGHPQREYYEPVSTISPDTSYSVMACLRGIVHQGNSVGYQP